MSVADGMASPRPAGERIPAATLGATIAAALLLALSADAGLPYVVLAVALGGYVVAFGLPAVMGATDIARSTAVLSVATLTGAWSVLRADGASSLRLLPVAIAVSLVASFVAQLTRRDSRPALTRCLAGDAFGITAIVSGMALAPLVDLRPDDVVVAAAMAGIVGASLMDPLAGRIEPELLMPGGLVLGALASAGVGLVAPSGAARWVYAEVSAVAGTGGQSVRRLLASLAGPDRGELAVAVCGVLLPGLAVFAVARLLLG